MQPGKPYALNLEKNCLVEDKDKRSFFRGERITKRTQKREATARKFPSWKPMLGLHLNYREQEMQEKGKGKRGVRGGGDLIKNHVLELLVVDGAHEDESLKGLPGGSTG